MLCTHSFVDNPLANFIEENIANFIEGTARSGRNLKVSDAEHNYNINDIYTNLLLTPLQQLSARVKVVGSEYPYDPETNLGTGKTLVQKLANTPSSSDD